MRILQIIPGTGNFYCGSCIRDTALVKGFRQLGHDVTVVPLYLPLFTDESGVKADTSVFLGGLNVYLQQKSNLFHKTPRWIDRLFDARWLLITSAKNVGMTKASELGEMTVSMMLGDQGRQAKELHRMVSWIQQQEPFDVAYLSNGMLLSLGAKIRSELNLPVACTLQGEDGFLDALHEPHHSQAWQLFSQLARQIDRLIPVSYYYKDTMKDRLQVEDSKFSVVQNGINLEGYGDLDGLPRTLTLGYLARMCQCKGLDTLVDAFIRLKADPQCQSLQLKIMGTKTKADDSFVDEQKNRLQEKGVLDSVVFLPNISREEKIRHLKTLTALSVPATYGEAFGLYTLEAMAAGVPVVQPRQAGFCEILERTNGGLLYDPDDRDAYVSTLKQMLLDPRQARRLGEQGKQAVFQHFSLERMAQEITNVFEQIRAT